MLSGQRRLQQFNKKLSNSRIICEHTFGRLKGRFPGLQYFGLHVNIRNMLTAIETLLILHNICIHLQDRPEDIESFKALQGFEDQEISGIVHQEQEEYIDPSQSVVNIPFHDTDEWNKLEGRRKRDLLLDEILPM